MMEIVAEFAKSHLKPIDDDHASSPIARATARRRSSAGRMNQDHLS
jgi:hypothetical protein